MVISSGDITQKTYKKIKKAGNSKNYELAVKEIFKNG